MRIGKDSRNWFTGRVLCYLLIAALLFPQCHVTAFASEGISPQEAAETDGGGHETIENSGFETSVTPAEQVILTEEEALPMPGLPEAETGLSDNDSGVLPDDTIPVEEKTEEETIEVIEEEDASGFVSEPELAENTPGSGDYEWDFQVTEDTTNFTVSGNSAPGEWKTWTVENPKRIIYPAEVPYYSGMQIKASLKVNGTAYPLENVEWCDEDPYDIVSIHPTGFDTATLSIDVSMMNYGTSCVYAKTEIRGEPIVSPKLYFQYNSWVVYAEESTVYIPRGKTVSVPVSLYTAEAFPFQPVIAAVSGTPTVAACTFKKSSASEYHISGQVTITGKTVGEGMAHVVVNKLPMRSIRYVVTDPMTNLQLNQTSLLIEEGESAGGGTYQLTATTTPANATSVSGNDMPLTYEWTSSDETVVTINADGKRCGLTPAGPGQAVVTVTAGGFSARCYVTVIGKPAEIQITDNQGVEHDDVFLDLSTEKKTKQLYTRLLPDSADSKSVVWTSDDPTIATVSATGFVTAKKPGKTRIRAVEKNRTGVTDDVLVTVGKTPTSIAVNLVKWNDRYKKWVADNSYTLEEGEKKAFRIAVTPSDATTTDGKKLTASDLVIFLQDESVLSYTLSTEDPMIVELERGKPGQTPVTVSYGAVSGTYLSLLVYGSEVEFQYDFSEADSVYDNGEPIYSGVRAGMYMHAPWCAGEKWGHRFAGWEYTKEDGTTGLWEPSTLITIPEPSTESVSGNGVKPFLLKATFKSEKADYNITYHTGGLQNHPDNPKTYQYDPAATAVALKPAASGDGFRFAGWYQDPSLQYVITEINPEYMYWDLDIYAKVVADTVRVTFDPNVPAGNYTLKNKMADVEDAYVGMQLPKNAYAVSDCVFMGWSTSAETEPFDGGLIMNQSTLTQTTWSKQQILGTENVIRLYAVWLKKGDAVNITFDENGGILSGTVPTTFAYGTGITAKAMPVPTRDGYTFAGWYNEAGKRVTGIAASQTAEVTLTAKWTALPYTIVYNANPVPGDRVSGKMANQTGIYSDEGGGTTVSLRYNAFSSRANRTFLGWSTDQKAVTPDYSDAGDVFLQGGLVPKPGKNTIKLYAVWGEPQTYGISYNTAGGEWKPGYTPSAGYLYGTGTSLPSAEQITRDGFAFAGWYNTAGKKLTSVPKSSVGNIDLTARWSVNFRVVYHSDTAVRPVTTKTVKFESGKAYALVANPFRLKGWVLSGWAGSEADAKSGNIIDGYTNGAKILLDTNRLTKAGDNLYEMHLYAVWRNRFTVRYMGSGDNGTVAAGESLPSPAAWQYTFGDARALIPAEKDGYTFKGWFTAAGKQVKSIAKSTYGDLELYPRYTPKKVTVLFDNGGSTYGVKTVTKKQTIDYGTKKALVKNTFSINNQVFLGWRLAVSTLPYGECDYQDNSLLDTGALLPVYGDGIIRLTAIWSPRVYTVKYEHYDEVVSGSRTSLVKVSSDVADQMIKYEPKYEGSPVINDHTDHYVYDYYDGGTLSVPVRPGYTFLGWYSNKQCTKMVDSNFIPPGTTGNKTYYGKWRRNQ